MLPNSKTSPSLPLRRPVQLTDCVSNSMKARKMPFIIFTSRANNKPSRLFHIPHPVGPPSRHVVAVVLAFPVVFVVLWLIIIICAFYISVFYCSTFLIHTQTHTHTHSHTHRDTVAYSLRNRTFSLTSLGTTSRIRNVSNFICCR